MWYATSKYKPTQAILYLCPRHIVLRKLKAFWLVMLTRSACEVNRPSIYSMLQNAQPSWEGGLSDSRLHTRGTVQTAKMSNLNENKFDQHVKVWEGILHTSITRNIQTRPPWCLLKQTQ